MCGVKITSEYLSDITPWENDANAVASKFSDALTLFQAYKLLTTIIITITTTTTAAATTTTTTFYPLIIYIPQAQTV